MPTERLGRSLARAGVASRRASDRLIAEGRVTVNGVVPPPNGIEVDRLVDRVAVDGREVDLGNRPFRYLAVNKPLGVVSTTRDPGGRTTVLALVEDPVGLFPVGRLDIDSRGLMLLTDDGELSLRLTHPRYAVPKRYVVTVAGVVDGRQLSALRAGPRLSDGPSRPLSVRLLRQGRGLALLEIAIAEGRKRELRRMCAAVGAKVTDLERVAIGPLKLGGCAPGASRELGANEVQRLLAFVGLR